MKKCTKCLTDKPFSEFHKQSSTNDGYKYVCKPCSAENFKARYIANPKKYVENAKRNKPARVLKARQFVLDYLLAHPCVDCGYSNPRALQFDHLEDFVKVSGVAKMAGDGYSIETIKQEIAKCEVRCCNCHSIKTLERSGSWFDRITQGDSNGHYYS